VCFYRGPHDEFKDFFSQEVGVEFCNDVCSVMEVLGHAFNPYQWRLFIDWSKVSMKVVLLHNGNTGSAKKMYTHFNEKKNSTLYNRLM